MDVLINFSVTEQLFRQKKWRLVQDAIPWWLKRIGPTNLKSHSVRAPEDRHIKAPGPVTEGRRQREQQEHNFLSMSLCFDSDVEHLTVIDPEREE